MHGEEGLYKDETFPPLLSNQGYIWKDIEMNPSGEKKKETL